MSRAVNSDTVDAALESAMLFWKREEEAGASFNGRASAIVAFGGVILSIIGVFHREDGVAFKASSIPAGVAMLALLFAVFAVIFGVLIPKSGSIMAMSELRALPTYAVVSGSPEALKGKVLIGLITSIERERRRNEGKAGWLRLAYIAVAFGLLFVAVDAVLVARSSSDGQRTDRPDWHGSFDGNHDRGRPWDND